MLKILSSLTFNICNENIRALAFTV